MMPARIEKLDMLIQIMLFNMSNILTMWIKLMPESIYLIGYPDRYPVLQLLS